MYEVKASSSTRKKVKTVLASQSDEDTERCKEFLRNTPKNIHEKEIKKLKGRKKLWEYRFSDGSRLVYRVHDSPIKVVLIYFAGDHKDTQTFIRQFRG